MRATGFPPTDRSTLREVLWPLLAAAVLIAGLQVAGFHGVRHDDAYITYRYGQNLARGSGFVFNTGEHILGTTAPGHAVLSAAAYMLFGRDAMPSVMSGIGCLAWTAQAVAVFLLLVPALTRREALVVSVFVAVGVAGSAQWIALETNLAVALTLLAVHSARCARWVTAAVLCAAAGFVRPDAHLVSVLLGVVCVIHLRRRAWLPLLAFTVPTVCWAGYCFVSFGSVVPQTAIAKFHNASLGAYGQHVFLHPAEVLGSISSWPAAVVLWAVAAGGCGVLLRRDRWLGILAAYGLLHLATHLYIRPFQEHVWHLYPAALLFAVFVLSALAAAPRLAGDGWPVRAAVGVVLGLLFAAVVLRTADFARHHAHNYWYGSRDSAYREIATHLRRHASPSDTVASIEVGTLAYYTDLRMHDWSSLVTPRGIVYPPAVAPYQWVLLYTKFLRMAPRLPPSLVARSGDFAAYLFDLRPIQEQFRRSGWQSMDRRSR